jgi:alpha-beta hydrolase superfamily lysophospholipase
MKIIILPGNSRDSNERWLGEYTTIFSDMGKSVSSQRYTHWDTNRKTIDFDTELQRLSEVLGKEEKYIIFAKSAGAILTIYGVYRGVLKPEKCVFVGLPLKWAKDNNVSLAGWMEKFDIPTLIIQQNSDPYASFQEIQDFLKKLNRTNVTIEEIPGDDHRYENFSLFKHEVTSFFEK